jgi:hypothetical protein
MRYHRGSNIRAEISAMPRAGVIGMTMREKGAFHGAPRVNVKLSGRAIYPAICETKKC